MKRKAAAGVGKARMVREWQPYGDATRAPYREESIVELAAGEEPPAGAEEVAADAEPHDWQRLDEGESEELAAEGEEG